MIQTQQITPPFKISRHQVFDLKSCAELTGLDSSKIARAAIQLMFEEIKNASDSELQLLTHKIAMANARSTCRTSGVI